MAHMVRPLVVGGVIGLLAGGTVGGQAPDTAARGATVLAEARKALGGEERLAAIRRLAIKGETRRMQGNQTIEGDVEILVELPDKYLRREELLLGGPAGLLVERVEALNGSEAWERVDGNLPGRRGGFGDGGRGGFDGGRDGRGGFGGGRGAIGELLSGIAGGRGQPNIDPAVLREAQRRARQAEFARLLLGILLWTDAPVAWIGTAQSPDGTADVIEITPKEAPPMRLLVDAATRMPLMITWQGGQGGGGRGGVGRGGRGQGRGPEASAATPTSQSPAESNASALAAQVGGGRRGGGPAAMQASVQMHLGDYKTVNGIKLPHLITRGTDGQTSEELEIKSYRLNPNFRADTFIEGK
jgi:hypothetical protein